MDLRHHRQRQRVPLVLSKILLGHLVSDGVAGRCVEMLPPINQTLQISVKRCQEVTLEALKMQRPCSVASLAVFAIPYNRITCGEMWRRFDSRRLPPSVGCATTVAIMPKPMTCTGPLLVCHHRGLFHEGSPWLR